MDICEHQKGEAWNRLFFSVGTERLIFSKQAHPREPLHQCDTAALLFLSHQERAARLEQLPQLKDRRLSVLYGSNAGGTTKSQNQHNSF